MSIQSFIIMLLLLSLLILVHEAGHFLVAKLFKMRVDKFGFGLPIGPTLFQKKIGNVTVLVHAFLLGGYVSFPDDEKDCDLPADSPERFLNKPVYQRAFVVSAGVISNVICAYLLVLFTAFHWGYLPAGKYDVYVNKIVAEQSSSIWKSGLQNGDQILKINNTPITNTASILALINLSKEKDGYYNEHRAKENLVQLKKLNRAYTDDEIIPSGVLIKLPKREVEHPISFSKETEQGIIRYQSKDLELPKGIDALRDDIADSAYYTGNDKYTLKDIAIALSDTVHPLNFVVNRDGKHIALKSIYPDKNGKIGVELAQKEVLTKTKGVKAIVKQGTKYLWYNTYNMVYGLGQIFTGKVPMKDLHGIVAITKIGSDIIASSGMFYGLLLTAIISMDLAIVNFLPIPALDGGHILFLIIEKIRGKRLKDETVEKIGTFFFSLLIVLMVVIIFNDIVWLNS